MKHFLIFLTTLLVFASCSKDESNNEIPVQNKRTVIVYMSAENDLNASIYYGGDINEMINGVRKISDDDQLLVFADRADATQTPFIARVTKDEQHPLDTLYKYPQDFYASDPAEFKKVLEQSIALSPAEEYALVLWGHASGWLIENDSIATTTASSAPRQAYGRDTGDNTANSSKGKWLNIPSMRAALEDLYVNGQPLVWKYIFCDCCNMMCAEVAYELRHVTEYLIGSPAEIPGRGAPYKSVVPDLFSQDDNFYKYIIDDYAAEYPNHLPLSAVKTSAMADLADATRSLLLDEIKHTPDRQWSMNGSIYYHGNAGNYKILYDMYQFVKEHVADEDFALWKQFFDKAVVYKKFSQEWDTNGHVSKQDFDTFKEEMYGGLSMFIPLSAYNGRSSNDNENAKKMSWYYAVGWPELGW